MFSNHRINPNQPNNIDAFKVMLAEATALENDKALEIYIGTLAFVTKSIIAFEKYRYTAEGSTDPNPAADVIDAYLKFHQLYKTKLKHSDRRFRSRVLDTLLEEYALFASDHLEDTVNFNISVANLMQACQLLRLAIDYRRNLEINASKSIAYSHYDSATEIITDESADANDEEELGSSFDTNTGATETDSEREIPAVPNNTPADLSSFLKTRNNRLSLWKYTEENSDTELKLIDLNEESELDDAEEELTPARLTKW